MTYKEMAENIVIDIKREIGIFCTIHIVTQDSFLRAKNVAKKSRNISTYKEMNKLFAGTLFTAGRIQKNLSSKKIRLTIPFLGKVV
jgi:hypothetical protein